MTALLEQIIADRTDLADGRHSPTRAMQVVAKRGVRLAANHPDIDPVALAVGRKVASGQKLSNEHVEHMASYHAAWDSPPVGDTNTDSVEHMLWAGDPGARWSSARVAAMDVSALGDTEVPDLLALAAEGKSPFFEVFVRDTLGEEAEVDEQNQLVWSPILRSGMLATRPGPGGVKLNEPLVFIPGHSEDPRRQIGLQDLHDAFQKKAFEHVTIPTSHENDLLDNTGFIVDTKIVPSKRRPGEHVLMAAHDFRDPDVRKKVELGTIANRSCGIVYDHVNTETGEHFPVAIEHVALTNKPWVRGMAPYGAEDFAEHEVVPMLLSEAPRTDLAADHTDTAWDGSESRFNDQQWARACILDRGTGTAKQRYSLPIREPDGTLNSNGAHAAAGRLNQVKGASLAQKKSAARALIAAYRKLGEEPPENVTKLVTTSTNLSEAERKQILFADVKWGANELSMNDITNQVTAALSDFGHPDEYYPIYSVWDVVASPDPKALVKVNYGDAQGVDDAWVVPLEIDGDKVSLSDYSQWTPVQKEWVADEDADQDKQEVADLIGDKELLSEAPSPKPSGSNTGGAMKPTTQEVMERLGLSDEQRAALAPLVEQNQQLSTQLAEERKERRKEAITARVKALQAAAFTPGFCKTYEEIALGDDGETAAALNLSDENGAQTGEKNYTVTEVMDRLIAAIPIKDGKIVLSESANLLTSPVSGRPPADEKDADKLAGNGEKSAAERADEFLEMADQAVPGIVAQTGMALSTDPKKEN